MLEKKQRLRETLPHANISPELLLLLTGDPGKARPSAWAELRQQLGLKWDSSPDYVLVSKQALRRLDYPRLLSGSRISETASDLLALSPEEQSALQLAFQQSQQGWQGPKVERTEPNGDVVAQYSVSSTDAAFEQSLSNNFATGIARVVGPERADFLLPGAWREFRSQLGPREAETMTIRRSVVDGEPDLVCEMKRGEQIPTQPVRYAHYPSRWFLTAFPGGWKTLADREGFELPRNFQR